MKNLLVTGANGFVGRWLVRAARADGWQVSAVIGPGGAEPHEWLTDEELSGVTTVRADFADPDSTRAVATTPADAVVHLAAIASGAAARRDPAGAMAVNADGTAQFVRALVRGSERPRIVVVSSGEVYGAGHDSPIPESTEVAPVSPYALSKVAAEEALTRDDSDHQLDLMIVRPFPHTGPGQSRDYVLPAFAARLLEARRTGQREIAVGNLDVVRDFLDVRDVVRAYLLLLRHGHRGATYNVASGIGRSLKECLSLLADRIGVDVQPVVDPAWVRPSDIPVLIGDATLLKQTTGWTPSYTFEQTLQDLVDAQAD